MDKLPALEALRAAWERLRDGQSARDLGEALESMGRVEEAATIYRDAMADYLSAYYHLAWLERARGNTELAMELLETYLAKDDEPDEFTLHVAGVLGHWRWHFLNRLDAEALLREGEDHYESARADLASLLKSTGRLEEAIEVLERGVAEGETESFLPLANIREEAGDFAEAERLFRLGYALGDAFSAYNLHTMLMDLDRNDEAREWLWLAAQGGDELAIRRLAQDGDAEDGRE